MKMLFLKKVLASEGQTYGELMSKGTQIAQQTVNTLTQLERNSESDAAFPFHQVLSEDPQVNDGLILN